MDGWEGCSCEGCSCEEQERKITPSLHHSPTPLQVRLNVIAKLEAVHAVIGLKQLAQSLLPAITELSGDKTWRVRQAVIDFTPRLAPLMGTDFFEPSSKLTDLSIAWLSDPVFAIREAAMGNLKRLTLTFGPAWAERVLVPRLMGLVDAASAAGSSAALLSAASPFQLRMTALLALSVRVDGVGGVRRRSTVHTFCLPQSTLPHPPLQSVAEALPPPSCTSRLLPALVAFARDPVPNVRFNVAKALARLAKAGKIEPAALAASVRPCCATLLQDADNDVRREAATAQRACV